MKKAKKVAVDEKVPVELSEADRKLIVDKTFADPDLTDRLEAAPPVGERITVYYTLSELDDLLGYIAAEANHASSKKLEKKLDDLYERIQAIERSYADDLSPEWLRKLAR